jgi:shikimate dehydrogenase
VTKNYIGLLGRDIAYSLSPKLQGAALAAAGLDWEYLLLATEPENLPAALDKLRSPCWAGANVTVPYKQAVMPFLDSLDVSGEKVGAVNTIVNKHGKLRGYNTDCIGLARDLARLGISLKDKTVAIMGAGGGAAAALALTGDSRVSIICQNREKGIGLVKGRGQVQVMPWRQAPVCDVLINCTPPNSGWQRLTSKAEVIYDLNYHEPTPPQGRYYNGLGMLMFQGAEAFRLWTGSAPPLTAMAAALGLNL